MATMRDVAVEAGVSVATVSASISGRRFVSQELKARINDAISALGYRPDAVARSLKTGNSDLLGLVIPDISNPFFTEFVREVELMAKAYGYSTILGDSGYEVTTERKMLDLMRQQRVDGVVLCPAGARADYRFDEWPENVPLVVVDNAWNDAPFDTVALDNVAAGAAITHHITGLGHTDVAIIAGPQGNHTSDERRDGFLRALKAAGIVPPHDYIHHADFREAGGYAAANALLDLPRRPSAIFVANNNMLIGVMRALHDRRLRVPDEISVASIDDFPWAGAFRPGLTVARQPVADFAQHALRLVRKRVTEEEKTPREAIKLQAELVIRESVRKR